MRAILEQKSGQLPIALSEVREQFALSETDDEIKTLLQNAIEHVELQTGLSLQRKTWKVIHDNAYLMLAYGPVITILSITDNSGNAVEPMSIKRAHDNLILQFAQDGIFKVRYEAGYDEKTLPNCLKHTILEKFWDLYSTQLINDDSIEDISMATKTRDYAKYHFNI